MTNLDEETLFSLELIVDQLSLLHTVECRIPAVAFRLLDFPTLLIYHVEPELAHLIRLKLLEDYQPVPSQLNELKDHKTGAFSVSHGKSCLFRVSPNMLVSSLCSAPLYVMVVDMFPETPKLVASCGLPLNVCACNLYGSIVTNGVSIPAVQGERKELDLCDLMGKKLGTLLLGYRLLSLGASLLSHIPAHNVIHLKTKEVTDKCAYSAVDALTRSVAKESVVGQKSTNEERSENSEVRQIQEKTFVDSQTQIEPRGSGSVGTQTLRQRSHAGTLRKSSLINDVDDAITTNIVCPPPLFYSSSAFKKTVYRHQDEWSSVWQIANDSRSWSDDETIRVEDKYLDTYEDVGCHCTKDKYPPSLAERQNIIRSDPAAERVYHPHNVAEFPILSALMAEILKFQGMNLVHDNSGIDTGHQPQYLVHKLKSGIQLPKRDIVKAFEQKLSAHKCDNMQTRDKGRVSSKCRSAGASAHRKPFFAGMTNTQRLRLARVNPNLLQQLEAKEVARKIQFRAARVSSKRQKDSISTDSHQKCADKIDTSNHIDISGLPEYNSESRESTARYKCPVPTPRTSKMHVSERLHPDKNDADVDVSYFGTGAYAASHKRVESYLPLQSSSEETVQFALSAVEHNVENRPAVGCGDSDSRPLEHARLVPATVVPADTSATNAECLLSVEDLGLQKIVDHYSSDSDSDNKESKNRNAECHSAEQREVISGNKIVEDGGMGSEKLQLCKVANQCSAASEDEPSDPDEYEYDFEDTPVQSLKNASTINSTARSAVDDAERLRTRSSAVTWEAGVNLEMSAHSVPTESFGECCNY